MRDPITLGAILFGVFVLACAAAWLTGLVLIGQAIGLVMMFFLSAIASLFFVVPIVKTFKLPVWSGALLLFVAASALAYGLVFYAGPTAEFGCIPSGSTIYNDC